MDSKRGRGVSGLNWAVVGRVPRRSQAIMEATKALQSLSVSEGLLETINKRVRHRLGLVETECVQTKATLYPSSLHGLVATSFLA